VLISIFRYVDRRASSIGYAIHMRLGWRLSLDQRKFSTKPHMIKIGDYASAIARALRRTTEGLGATG
jgi:hypothetical protein